MDHSPKFEQLRNYWIMGLWKEPQMRAAVVKGWITAEEFEEITGLTY